MARPITSPPSTTVTVRLPVELHDALQALATSTERSRSWHAQKAIVQYLKQPLKDPGGALGT